MTKIWKTLKFIGVFLASLISLFFLIWLALQFPAIQTYVVQQLTKSLEKQTGTTITVEHVDIEFFKTIVLEGVYIADQQQDTLVYAREIKGEIGLFSLFNKQLSISDIQLSDAVVRLSELDETGIYNYQFLVDRFSPKESKPTSSKPWTFQLKDVSMQHSRLQVVDRNDFRLISGSIGSLQLDIDEFNAGEESLSVHSLKLDKTNLQIQKPKATNVKTKVAHDTLQVRIDFPGLPWPVRINALTGQALSISYHDHNYPRTKGSSINLNHMDFVDVNLRTNALYWDENSINIQLQTFQLKHRSPYFELKNLASTIAIDTNHIRLMDFDVETVNSQLSSQVNLRFKNWGALFRDLEPENIDVYLKHASLAEKDIHFLSPQMKNFIQMPKGRSVDISGSVNGHLRHLNFNNLKINLPQQFRLLAEGQVLNINNTKNTKLNIRIKHAQSTAAQIQKLFPSASLPPALHTLGHVTLKSGIQGSLQHLRFNNIDLRSDSSTYFKGHAELLHLFNKKDLEFRLDIDTLSTRLNDWQPFLSKEPSKNIDALGMVSYNGKVNGKGSAFTLNGLATTAIGRLKSDLQITFEDKYTDATYNGNLYLMDFDLSKVTSDSAALGLATIYFIGSGSGLSLENLSANMEAVVEKLMFKEYPYEYLNIEGQFENKKFQGFARFEDDNASFNFSGLVNLSEDVPVFDFDIHVDSIHFQRLNLMDHPVKLATDARINFTGTRLADIEGSITFKDLDLRDSSYILQEDSISFVAKTISPTHKNLDIYAEFLDAEVDGNYDLDLLPLVAQYFVNDFIPLAIDTSLNEDQQTRIQTQNFDFNIKLNNSRPFQILGFSEEEMVEQGFVNGNFNYQNKQLNIQGTLDNARFQGMRADTLNIQARGTSKRIQATLDAVAFQTSGINIPQLSLRTKLIPDSLQLGIDIQNDSDELLLQLDGVATANANDYTFRFEDKIILDKTPWSIDPRNAIYFSNKNLFIEGFHLSNDNSAIQVQSLGGYHPESEPDVQLSFSNFQLTSLLGLATLPSNQISGNVNGQAIVANPLTQPIYKAEITIENLTAQNETVGDLLVHFQQDVTDPLIDFDVKLIGPSKTLDAKGKLETNTGEMDIDGQLTAFDLVLIAPFTSGTISNLQGYTTGKFAINGTMQQPSFSSTLQLKNVTSKINFLNTEIGIPETEIIINPNAIQLGQIQVTGPEKRSGVLTGSITHTYFQKFLMDLQFRSNDFQLLNTTLKENNLFWGQANLKTTVDMKGSFRRPVIAINASTLPNSTFTFQVNPDDTAVGQSPYILFANPGLLDEAQRQIIGEQIALARTLKIDLVINLEVTPDAELTILLDPVSGDKIVGRGDANLVLRITPDGAITMNGTYDLTSGNYLFSYGPLINRSFALESGSKVIFSGDPLKSQLDITAIYSNNTTTHDLINNQTTLTSQEAQTLRKRTAVNTKLFLSGDLSRPDIKFDIQIPEIKGSILNSAINRKLAELRSDQAEMNKQVFSLLLFNTFFPSISAGNTIVGRGEDLALSSVSKLVSTQLNNLTDKYIKGVEISIDFETYQTAQTTVADKAVLTELQVALSKNLFNDRLTISAGADIGLNARQTDKFSAITGDFVLEYKLTPSGNYIVKIFRKSDFDILKDENTAKNGLAISAKRNFGKINK